MRRSWAAVTVGAVAIVTLAAAFTMFRFTSEKMSSNDGIVVYALFRDALGLYEKSRVLAAGLDVGQIEGKTLDPTTRLAKITLRLDTEKLQIYKNATVSKKAASLLGEFVLDIDPGTADHPPMKDGDRIVNVFEPVAVGEIIDQVGATIPVLREILQDVRQLTSGEVRQIAQNVNKLIETNSATLASLLTRVDNIAATVEGITRQEADDIRVSIQNIRQITEGVRSLVGTAEGQVAGRGEQLKTSIEKLESSIDSLEKTMKNTETVTGKIAEGEGTVGRLVTDDTVARNLEDITTDASSFVRGVTRLQTIVGLRTEYNYIANQFKTYFQVQLQPRPDKFYLIEIVDDPRGYREKTKRVRDSSRDSLEIEDEITTTEKLKVSFQFGKRIGPVTGRFGMIESTGGAGLDFHLLSDALTLSTEVFDARSNQHVRFRARGTLNVYKQLVSVVGGVDDVFNYTRSVGGPANLFDWFFGAQLTFNDEDLKSILLFGGGAAAGAR